MDVNTLIAMLTDGLPADQAATVRSAIERDAVKSKVSTIKQESEYQELQTRSAAAQAELDGDAASGKLGAKAYREWYEKNYPAVQKLQRDMATYQEKYGTLENPVNPQNPNPQNPSFGFKSQDEFNSAVEAAAQRVIQNGYAPKWSDLLINTGTLVQKHMFAGRKTPIDFNQVSKLANEKYAGSLELAYDEWDRPEREKISKQQEEERINKRVEEELQKRGASAQFPSGADMTAKSTFRESTKEALDKFDPVALKQDLAAEWYKSGAA